jgi:ribosome biogenesis protein ERB1
MTARKMNKGKKGTTKSSQTAAAATPPELSRLDSGDDASDGDDESSVSVYDSGSEEEYDSNDDDVARGDEEESDDDEDDNEEDEFEDQGSSDEDEDLLEKQANESDDDDDECEVLENVGEAYDIDAPRVWKSNATSKRSAGGKSKTMASTGTPENPNNDETAAWMNTDDLSSDDEDGEGKFNRIGKVPLHWYDEYDHLGYNAHGKQVAKPAAKDLLTQALEQQEDMANKKYVVQDALNGVDVTLTPRQLEIIRRVQSGAYAHPEFEGNAEFIDYYSSVKEISGINTDRHEPKNRFQPSKYEKLQVRRLLHRLERGAITMDFLTGKVRDMNDHIKKKKNIQDESKAFMLWKGDEEDELAFRKGPEHIPAPKVPPPGHAESYRPPDEYLPTEEDLEKWSEMDPKDRPHGLLIPQKFDNLRSLGAYEHSVRERFERCLDLYLCPRMMKRRLNIDPESLVPSLPKPNDLRPFPTAQCIKYETPTDSDSPPMIRAISVSPDGQFMVSGATDGFVRMWEVQTGRLLRSWNLSKAASELQGVGSSTEKDATENVSFHFYKQIYCFFHRKNL